MSAAISYAEQIKLQNTVTSLHKGVWAGGWSPNINLKGHQHQCISFFLLETKGTVKCIGSQYEVQSV